MNRSFIDHVLWENERGADYINEKEILGSAEETTLVITFLLQARVNYSISLASIILARGFSCDTHPF